MLFEMCCSKLRSTGITSGSLLFVLSLLLKLAKFHRRCNLKGTRLSVLCSRPPARLWMVAYLRLHLLSFLFSNGVAVRASSTVAAPACGRLARSACASS